MIRMVFSREGNGRGDKDEKKPFILSVHLFLCLWILNYAYITYSKMDASLFKGIGLMGIPVLPGSVTCIGMKISAYVN